MVIFTQHLKKYDPAMPALWSALLRIWAKIAGSRHYDIDEKISKDAAFIRRLFA